MQRVAAHPELRGWVTDRAPRPISSVGDDDGETGDFAVLVMIWNGGEGVPLKERLCRDLKSVEGLHCSVFEVEADSAVGKGLGIYIVSA